MTDIILKGRKISRGRTEGEALVSHEPVGFLAYINPATGFLVEKNHDWEGENISGKILVYPTGKGSTAGSLVILEMTRYKTAPRGIINVKSDPITATGAIISNIPMVDQLDSNPLDVIKTGDYLELDGDQGIVKIRRA